MGTTGLKCFTIINLQEYYGFLLIFFTVSHSYFIIFHSSHSFIFEATPTLFPASGKEMKMFLSISAQTWSLKCH